MIMRYAASFNFLKIILLIICVFVKVSNGQGYIELTPLEFKTMIDANEFDVIVDVRTQSEWDEGRIEGATFVESLQQFPNLAIPLGSPDDLMGCEYCTIAVYCRSGARARGAIQVLIDNGFQGRLYNGLGTSQWTGAGYPLSTTAPSVVPPCTTDQTVSDNCLNLFLASQSSNAPTASPSKLPSTSPSSAPTTSPSSAPTTSPTSDESNMSTSSSPNCFTWISATLGAVCASALILLSMRPAA